MYQFICLDIDIGAAKSKLLNTDVARESAACPVDSDGSVTVERYEIVES